MDPVLDAVHAYSLNSDPEVLKYTGDVAFKSIDEARVFLENYSDYREHGMGRWAVIRKEDGVFLGWCGLKQHKDYVDLGFRFMKIHWGHGYATEAAMGCIAYGFDILGLKELVARVDADNAASIRVITNCGFSYWKQGECKGIEDALYYRLTRVS